ncbi:HaeIII family restriction endonuclease [Candidatus Pacearchaeota archaeon]|nr:HaeIII family restriction endonuclease [Candidatus Pacearchaeota archaeon]
MTSVSNDNGRAFEYVIVLGLKKHLESLGIDYLETERTTVDNSRDMLKLKELPEAKQKDFILAASKFLEWVDSEGWFIGADKITIDRLPDKEGQRNNVTDIELKIEKGEDIEQKNISVKHNHDALKHPRLPNLVAQCGIEDETIDRLWRENHDAIWTEFNRKSKDLKADAKTFKELKDIDNSFIDKNLYKPLIDAVIKFLKENVKDNPDKVKSFFNFLTSDMDFYTVKNERLKVIIKKFLDITPPTVMNIEYPYLQRLNTFKITFDNDWEMTLRLHTASSRMYKSVRLINTSSKLDVMCINLDDLIDMEHIDKSN